MAVCLCGRRGGRRDGGTFVCLLMCVEEGWKEGGIEDISRWEMASNLIGF